MTTMMTDAPLAADALALNLPEALRSLIDARLDTIERMLLGRVARPDRLAIVRDVEGQIHEMLAGRCAGESAPDRDDVLAVLADLDPPEAYLPEEGEGISTGHGRLRVRLVAPTREPASSQPRPVPAVTSPLALWAGIMGLVSLALVLMVPVIYVMAVLISSEDVLFFGGLVVVLLLVIASIIAIVLASVSRLKGPWPIVGLVIGLIGLFTAVVSPIVGIVILG
jgi:hypothetical protein